MMVDVKVREEGDEMTTMKALKAAKKEIRTAMKVTLSGIRQESIQIQSADLSQSYLPLANNQRHQYM